MAVHRTDGYPTDVTYPAFFYPEMQPVWLHSVAGQLGFAAPAVDGAFRYCELGCGLGTNLLVAAACHPQARFVGVDANPRHVQAARAAAQAAGLVNLDFVHAGFAEWAAAAAPPFDYMATHGTWSWIAPTHQAALLACVKTGLRPGGIFYLHYMCHPGSTDLLALQHFLHQFAPHVPGSSAQQVQTGLKLLSQLAERGLFVDRPHVAKHLAALQQRDAQDLAHEFLTDHWQPQHGVDVHQQASTAGLAYLGSADVFNNLDISLSIPGQMQAVVRQTQIPALAETLKDMARNSHQRMDLFQRASQPLDRDTYAARLGATVFHLLPGAPTAGPLTFTTPIGPIQGPAALCTALLQRLAAGPTAFAELATLPAFAGQPGLLLQSLQLMQMQGLVHPANPAVAAGAADSRQVQALQRWWTGQGTGLQLVQACGTALRRGAAPGAPRGVSGVKSQG